MQNSSDPNLLTASRQIILRLRASMRVQIYECSLPWAYITFNTRICLKIIGGNIIVTSQLRDHYPVKFVKSTIEQHFE